MPQSLLNQRGWQVIFDPGCWSRSLPHAVEAFFYLDEPSVAAAAHADFVATFPFREETPLVRLDLSDRLAPFKVG